MENYASGDARLILHRGSETRQQIVDLNWTDRNKRQNFDVDANAERGGKGVLRRTTRKFRSEVADAVRLMRRTE